MRIAATADLHFTEQRYTILQEQLNRVRDDSDIFGSGWRPYQLRQDGRNGGQQTELMHMMTAAGIKVLDGSACERDGVGFAGTIRIHWGLRAWCVNGFR